MKKLFVIYEIARILKEKEFDEPCYMIELIASDKPYHSNNSGVIQKPMTNTECGKYSVAIPLYQQVIDWLEEKHNLRIVRYPEADDWWEIWEVLGMGYSKEKQCATLNQAIKEALKLI